MQREKKERENTLGTKADTVGEMHFTVKHVHDPIEIDRNGLMRSEMGILRHFSI